MEMRHPTAGNRDYAHVMRRKRQSGFTMMEVVFAMIIFLMTIAVFSAVFPYTVIASRYASNYQQASMLAQHKIDQLREVRYSGFYSGGSFYSSSLIADGVVDSCSASGTTYTCDFTSIDNIANNDVSDTKSTVIGYYPYGSKGTIIIQPDTVAGNDTGTGYPNAMNVTVKVTWTANGAPAGEFSTVAKFINMSHN